MELTTEQKECVREWLAAGDSLADVQRRLREDFGLSLTYMDVRLLTLDLGAQVKDKERPAEKKPEAAEAGGPDAPPPVADAGGLSGGVSVDLDKVVKPGFLVSGNVCFSDGVHATWGLDQMGRLAIQAAQPGYRPPEADLQVFQEKLRGLLERQGY